MKSIIDIHCHILPGIDDGARSVEETRDLLSRAWRQGIRTMIATPHYSAGRAQTDQAEVKRLGQIVQQQAAQINSGFRIEIGHELYYSDGIISDLKKGKALTLAQGNYVLVEFSPLDSFERIYSGTKKIIQAGYLVILAHFERYQSLQKYPERLYQLKELGVYLQMNISSLEGSFLKTRVRRCRNYILEGVVDFLATDCHRPEYRPPQVKGAMVWLNKYCEENYLDQLLHENARMILEHKIL